MTNSITLTCTGQGITNMLEAHVRSRVENGDRIINGDTNITYKEWDAVIAKLSELNNKKEPPIFRGKADVNSKDWHNNFVLYNGDKITFTEEEMDDLYKAMGIEFEKIKEKENTEVINTEEAINPNPYPQNYTDLINEKIPKEEKKFLTIAGITVLVFSLLAKKAVKSGFLIK